MPINFKIIEALILTKLNLKAFADGKLEFTSEQKEKLKATFGDKTEELTAKFSKEYNAKLEAGLNSKELDQTINAFLEENSNSEANTEDGEGNEEEESILQKAQKVIEIGASKDKQIKQLQADLLKLANEPEPETSIETVKLDNMKQIGHSETHLFSSNEKFNAIEGRSWNKNFKDITSKESTLDTVALTEWNTINIEKINSDIQDYAAKFSPNIETLLRDSYGIPAHWKLVSGVSDKYIMAKLVSGEITQARKKDWLPKNKSRFVPQIGKVYDVQIDIEYEGYELQKLEKTWLQSQFDLNGSDPYKLSFVQYLVENLIKHARKEDKIVLVKGVYNPSEDSNTPASYLNRMTGLLKLISLNRNQTYVPFKLGKPTKQNIFEYVKKMCDSLPYDIKTLPELRFGISPSWLRAYKEGWEFAKGVNTDYKGTMDSVDGYPNVKFDSLVQLEGSDLFYITLPDNITVMVDKVGEENNFSMIKKIRGIQIACDYKLGIMIECFGADIKASKMVSFENQLFFSNDVEICNDVYVPADANTTTLTAKYHNAIIVGKGNTSPKEVTDIIDVTPGELIYLKGDNEENPSTIKNNDKIILSGGDCVLKPNIELVLLVRSDSKLLEIKRVDLAKEYDGVKLNSDVTELDAAEGMEFVTSENTSQVEISDILNAIPGETYRITGGSDTNPSILKKSNSKFSLASDITLTTGKFIELTFTGQKFIEGKRG
ncbi:hypothetical protein [Aureivirga marina]|uniref:hypothetical protein n=1 Tax=Aureivirga marina TaxID=1182451 RepID=UPI0018C920D6|nr:hypothetical protein [Aureivirga marina]